LWERRGKSKSSIAVSVAIHVVAIAALATITFHYPLAGLFDKPEPLKSVPVRYVALRPRSTGAAPKSLARAARPMSIPSPTSFPVGVPAPATAASASAPSASAIGAGGTTGAAGRDPGIGIGIRPGIPDGRLATNPMTVPAQPMTEGQKAERALAAIYQEYLDSARADMNNPKRAPGDWSWGGKDGDKWGWDANGIHVGGITIPNVILAALPLNMAPTTSPVDVRTQNYIRQDIQMHAAVMSEDEFKQAVRRVRERVDRERRERMEKQQKKKEKDPPCC
jgi:hypothetical protein